MSPSPSPSPPEGNAVAAPGPGPNAADQEAAGVGDRQDAAGDQADQRHRGERPEVPAGGADGLVRGLLRQVPEQRRQAGHRRAGDGGDAGEDRQAPAQAGQAPQVAGVRPVVDDPDDEEQRRLERGVREQQRHAGPDGLGRARAEQGRQEPELADGPVREQQLQVELPQRPVPAEQHRRDAEEHHGRAQAGHRGRAPGEDRREPGDHVHPGLDHRRGVQVRADGRRRGHRAGQPEVERDLRGLRHRAEQHEQHAGGGRPAGRRVREQRRQRVRAGGLPEQHEAAEQRQAPGDRGQQRRAGGLDRVVVVRVEPDEQERRDAGQLPVHVEHQQVIGEDESEHRAGEREQGRREAPQAGLVRREVAGAVREDERADARDERDHDERERVEAQRDRQVQAGHPRQRLDDRLAAQDTGGVGRGDEHGRRRGERAQHEDAAAEAARGGDRRGGQDGVEPEDGQQHEVGASERSACGWGPSSLSARA